MLGHMYSAEALVMLDRITEARTFLEPKFIAELKEDDFIHRGSPGKIIVFLLISYKFHDNFLSRLEYKYKRGRPINFKVQFSCNIGPARGN